MDYSLLVGVQRADPFFEDISEHTAGERRGRVVGVEGVVGVEVEGAKRCHLVDELSHDTFRSALALCIRCRYGSQKNARAEQAEGDSTDNRDDGAGYIVLPWRH